MPKHYAKFVDRDSGVEVKMAPQAVSAKRQAQRKKKRRRKGA